PTPSPPPEPSTLSLHDALPISACPPGSFQEAVLAAVARAKAAVPVAESRIDTAAALVLAGAVELLEEGRTARVGSPTDNSPTYVDRKSTRLNSSHLGISYAVFC